MGCWQGAGRGRRHASWCQGAVGLTPVGCCEQLSRPVRVCMSQQQLSGGFTMCAADFVYYRTSWFITFPTVVGGSELMRVRHHTWHHGYSWEERMGGRLEERCERGR